ncbi:MAG: hypothetical protein WC816_00160 [Sphingomonas sp.]
MAEEFELGGRPVGERGRHQSSGSRRRGGSGRGERNGGGSHNRNVRSDGSALEPATTEQQQVVFGIFVAMTIGITFFQKIGYAPSRAFVVPLILPLAYAALAIGVLFARPVFRPERMIIYLVLAAVSTLSNVLFSPHFSINSIALYLALYLPFLVCFDTTEETHRRCLGFFGNVMLIFSAIVWAQQFIQFATSWQYWPNLEHMVPKNYLIPMFNYIQPIEWGTGLNLMKPSGIFFLEVSILSQFIAFAFIIELLFFHRTWRAVFLGATMFATFAGTGLVLLAVCLPVILTRLNVRSFTIILVTVFVAFLVALELHWFDLVAHRLGEFQQSGSSANSRFIAPLDRIRAALENQSAVYSGVGAGQIEQGGNTFWWPIVKTSVEYGLLEGILFYVFYLYSMFDKAPSRQFAFVLAIWFSFEGTLLTPLNPLGCVMLSAMFCMRDERRTRRRSSSSRHVEGQLDTPATAAAS